MKSRSMVDNSSLALLSFLAFLPHEHAQSPSALYTWDNTGNPEPNVENWVKNFGTNTVTLTISPPANCDYRNRHCRRGHCDHDGANRVRESATAAGGGTDVTGLDYLEFDLGHNGPANQRAVLCPSIDWLYFRCPWARFGRDTRSEYLSGTTHWFNGRSGRLPSHDWIQRPRSSCGGQRYLDPSGGRAGGTPLAARPDHP